MFAVFTKKIAAASGWYRLIVPEFTSRIVIQDESVRRRTACHIPRILRDHEDFKE
jgi:hypothetical protein